MLKKDMVIKDKKDTILRTIHLKTVDGEMNWVEKRDMALIEYVCYDDESCEKSFRTYDGGVTYDLYIGDKIIIEDILWVSHRTMFEDISSSAHFDDNEKQKQIELLDYALTKLK